METAGDDPKDVGASVLSTIFSHAEPPAEVISGLVSHKESFGTGWLVLQFIKQMGVGLPLEKLDLTGPHVCKGPRLIMLNRFLQSLRVGVGGFGKRVPASLKTLNLSKCDLSDSAGMNLLHSLPPSLEHLDLSENRLRLLSMEALKTAFIDDTLSKLLYLDVSKNPLGPSGVATLARGLSGSRGALLLQTLKLKRTGTKNEGVKALSEPSKEGKTPSLQRC
uniref:Uncharacterized protein n=1 Tax=Chromera velia CCMP2878 TaxID=1169474 RepID=A0A0G4I274_9ALVE|eukprot:Cvel_1709.t1-p1 / transcript=Cvel_1709.t1 / gene=Cvel_1709 / organism=Chromera_velia_CCMP2878 / gene_product=hypothetical protein / transcript_product=hypothetical protein / location=Cvel_scaffold61:132379-135073(-) / protein_length=220 / sequence_SO=supercontig / SO=protein_coding / is_pseudo=false